MEFILLILWRRMCRRYLLSQVGGTLFALWAISCRADIIHENAGKSKRVFDRFWRWDVSILFFGYWIQKKAGGTY